MHFHALLVSGLSKHTALYGLVQYIFSLNNSHLGASGALDNSISSNSLVSVLLVTVNIFSNILVNSLFNISVFSVFIYLYSHQSLSISVQSHFTLHFICSVLVKVLSIL
ncbi:hypothetical protein HOG21_00615 [bacterium]|nr:hypothetical protein [bacterium]